MCKKNLRTFIFLLILTPILYTCSLNPNNNNCEVDEENYPTTLYTLTDDELQELQEEFNYLNNEKICTTLNEYGLTWTNFCTTDNPNIQLLNKKNVISMAKTCLLKNQKFTNVTDTLSLEIENAQVMPFTNSTEWRIDFKPQHYKDYLVIDTQIVVWIYGNGVYRINNHWYSDIFIPECDIFDKDDCKRKISGIEIPWRDEKSRQHVFKITMRSLQSEPEKIIIPVYHENSRELRIAWKIRVGDAYKSWNIYFDTIVGEIVRIEKIFF